jgi:hypothetical protein
MPPLPATCSGSCFCGTSSFTVNGTPKLSAYCHCTLCQRLNGLQLILLVPVVPPDEYIMRTAAAFIHTIHFSSTDFHWVGSGALDSYSVESKPWKTRFRCKTCGCCIASFNSRTEEVSVFGGQLARSAEGKIINWEMLKPTAHIFYGTRMLDVNDTIPKWEGYENKSQQL